MIDKQKEEIFYAKDFNFSYSSVNKLLFSPSLFYKDYILNDREVRTDKHLVEGKLIHCLLFEPENLTDKFNIVPGKSPSDNIRKVLKDMSFYTDAKTLATCDDFIILDSLKNLNLFQSLKADESRIAKVKTEDNEPYWKFLNNSNVDVVDQDTLDRCKDHVDILNQNKEVAKLFANDNTDFELSSEDRFVEKYLKCDLINHKFGLHGFVDFYKIDHDKKEVIIADLKTTSKSISNFEESVEYYRYYIQAAIYFKLVYENLDEKIRDDYKILFKFVVIDRYNQVYIFDVLDDTMRGWAFMLSDILNQLEYHYTEKDYSLPYDFATQKIKL
tara:strand:- start:4389 stop:5375 length:987 start_codon:yes stop_codon:yes gene_type:complete